MATDRYDHESAGRRWRVPDRDNIVADVCDKHPADALAMLHEHLGPHPGPVA